MENNYWLDTNILVRYIAKDDEALHQKSLKILENAATNKLSIHIGYLVLHEAIYVLEKMYKMDRKLIANTLKGILNAKVFKIHELSKESLYDSLDDYKNTRVDFPDCVYKQICKYSKFKLLSFDSDFKKINQKAYDSIG